MHLRLRYQLILVITVFACCLTTFLQRHFASKQTFVTVGVRQNSPAILLSRGPLIAMASVSQVAIITVQKNSGLQLFGKWQTEFSNARVDVACSLLVNGQTKAGAVYARRISTQATGRQVVDFFNDVSSFGKLNVSFESETLLLLVGTGADASFDDSSTSVVLRFELKHASSSSADVLVANVALRKTTALSNFANDATTRTLNSAVFHANEQAGSLRTYAVFVSKVDAARFPPVSSSTFVRLNKIYEVGHRGCGISYSTKADTINAFVTENTIASFNYASKKADFIELDVIVGSQQDRVPFVYHDWIVGARTVRRDASGSDLVKHGVVQFTQRQLQSLSIEHETALENKTLSPSDETPSDFSASDENKRRFETLQRTLEVTEADLGINVEIKYPILEKNGLLETDGFIDRNAYIDAIVDVLEKDAQRREAANKPARRIIISSFDPDTCVIATLKQSRYPVAFLAPWNDYQDWRQADVSSASAYAASVGLYGLVFDSRQLPAGEQQLKELVSFLTEQKLRVWTWSSLNMDVNERKKQINAGVDGIIMDRIYTITTTPVPE